MRIALTASINLARHYGLMALKAAFRDEDFTDSELQLCPVEINASRISCFSRTVILKGQCRGKKFTIRVGLMQPQSRDDRWSIGGVTSTYDECEFHHNAWSLARALGIDMELLATAN